MTKREKNGSKDMTFVHWKTALRIICVLLILISCARWECVISNSSILILRCHASCSICKMKCRLISTIKFEQLQFTLCIWLCDRGGPIENRIAIHCCMCDSLSIFNWSHCGSCVFYFDWKSTRHPSRGIVGGLATPVNYKQTHGDRCFYTNPTNHEH